MENNNHIEEQAFIGITRGKIGVSNSEADLLLLYRSLKHGEYMLVQTGFKKELLDKENTILRIDDAYNAHGDDVVEYTLRNTDYNMMQRTRNQQKLRKFYMLGQENENGEVEFPDEIFGGLIEGGNISK